MEMNTLNAGENANLANDLISKALRETEPEAVSDIEIKLPSDNTVNLPGGYVTFAGEVILTAEVRELTGKDEEAIARATTVGKILNTILARGTTRVGSIKADEDILNNLLAGDRDAIMIGIYRATFGDTAELNGWCASCGEARMVEVDVTTDIKYRTLENPIVDRQFIVEGKHEYGVSLPTGLVQKELNNSVDKTVAELTTLLLEKTVVEIDGEPVFGKAQVQNMGLQDRRKVSEEILKRNPGPQFDDVKVECPECATEVVVPVNLGALFRI